MATSSDSSANSGTRRCRASVWNVSLSYHKFLEHVTPYMDFMKRELDNQRPPANIMEAARKGYFR